MDKMENKPLYKVEKVVHSDMDGVVLYGVSVRYEDHWGPQMGSCNGYAYREINLLEGDVKKKAFVIKRIRDEDRKRIHSGIHLPTSHVCSGMDLEGVVKHCMDLTEKIRIEDFKQRSSSGRNEVWLE